MLPLNDPRKTLGRLRKRLPVRGVRTSDPKSQIEYEPQYDDGLPLVLMHAGCHGVWEAERRRRRYARLIGKI